MRSQRFVPLDDAFDTACEPCAIERAAKANEVGARVSARSRVHLRDEPEPALRRGGRVARLGYGPLHPGRSCARVSSGDSATAVAIARNVDRSKKTAIVSSRPQWRRTRAMTRVASNESPPSAKKSSPGATFGSLSTSHHIRASAASNGPPAARAVSIPLRQARSDEMLQRALVGTRVRVEHDSGSNFLTETLVRYRECDCLRDRGML